MILNIARFAIIASLLGRFPIYSTAKEIVKCGAPRGLIPTVLLEIRTLLGSRK
jgi:hypothetical protein